MPRCSNEEMKRREQRFAEIYVFEKPGHQVNSYRQLCMECDLHPSEKSIRSNALKYFRREGTQYWVKEYQKEAREVFQINKENIVAALNDIALNDETNVRDRVAALKELNSMAGFKAQTIDMNANQTIEVNLENFEH